MVTHIKHNLQLQDSQSGSAVDREVVAGRKTLEIRRRYHRGNIRDSANTIVIATLLRMDLCLEDGSFWEERPVG